MAEISKLNLTGSDLDIKDTIARQKLTVVDPTVGEGLITFGVDANGNYGYKNRLLHFVNFVRSMSLLPLLGYIPTGVVLTMMSAS